MDANGVSSPRPDVCAQAASARDVLRAREAIEAWCRNPRSTQRGREVGELARVAPAVAIAAGLAEEVAVAPDAAETKRIVRNLDAKSYAALRRELVERGLESDTFATWFDEPDSWQWSHGGEEGTAPDALAAVRAMDGGEGCVRAMQAMLSNALREVNGLDAHLDTVGLYLTP
jgi:hypothetical protein